MAAKGRLFGAKYGPDPHVSDISASANILTYAMPTQNNGWSARFIATQSKDIASVVLSWLTITAPGTVTVRIETDASGKPSGNLYDANATITAAPTAGTQTFTFASVPTTNLTIGAAYHVVVLTATTGTAHTLRSHAGNAIIQSTYPINTLTAADGTTRTNFAEVTSSPPIASFILDDASVDSMGMQPVTGTTTSTNLITTAGSVAVAGMKFVSDATLVVAGLEFELNAAGTPTANLRIRFYDSTDTLVIGSTITLPNADLILGGKNNRVQWAAYFDSGTVLSLLAGTYRTVLDGAADTSSANCWVFRGITQLQAGDAPSGFSLTTAPNIASPSWTDTAEQPAMRLILDDITVPASSGSGFLIT